MKKTSLLILSGLLLATAATAQTEKGARFIGANVGNLSYSKGRGSNAASSLSASLYPSAGIFVADNFLLGAGLQLSYARYKLGYASADYSTRILEYGISPFARYYFAGTDAHRFFGQLEAGIQRQHIRQPYYYSSGVDRSSDTYGQAGLALGYNYFLAPGAALEVTAGYTRTSGDRNSFSTGALDVRAGFSVFLPSKGTVAPGQ